MGWEDTSLPFYEKRVPNNDIYHTPNMERLAAKGIQLTQGYAASICSPSRVSLMTGSNAARHRVTNWTLHYNTPTDVEDPIITPPDWNVMAFRLYLIFLALITLVLFRSCSKMWAITLSV